MKNIATSVALFTGIFLAQSSFSSENKTQFIADINRIIEKVAQPRTDLQALEKAFLINGSLPGLADLIFFGENHINEEALLNQASALEHLIRPGDVILFEGGNASEPTDCTEQIIFHLFIVAKWNASGQPYDEIQFNELDNSYFSLWQDFKDELNLSHLKMNQAKCYFWDDVAAIPVKPKSESFKLRHLAMVKELERHMGGAKKVFVNAGYLHLPSGELDSFRNYIVTKYINPASYGLTLEETPKLNLDGYFSRVQHAASKDAREDKTLFGIGSTQVIFDFLKGKNYVELIPHHLIKFKN